ncbi:hypothetical protein C7445_106101 [Alicyclobacillus sacchari]|uniref:Uncharacterized protein n=1 Tax=Alicyclobacillus sacchari TaxID=392010 RepID=A0A4R8LMW8_9BACL|nr:hypothetical protein [Alicyclobacillus sacchari]TDY46675.1 hypothetical protein C7445_106101 [Alicyclobacillus sacchari]
MAKTQGNKRKARGARGARGQFRAMARELGLTESEFQRLAVALTKTLKGAALTGETPVSARDLLAMLESPVVQTLFAAMIGNVLKGTSMTDPASEPADIAPVLPQRTQSPSTWPRQSPQGPLPPHVHTHPPLQPPALHPGFPGWYNLPPTGSATASAPPAPTPAVAPARFARQSGARECRRAH